MFRKHGSPYERFKKQAEAALTEDAEAALDQQYQQIIAEQGEQAAIAALQEDAIRAILQLAAQGYYLTGKEFDEMARGYQAFAFEVFSDHYGQQGLEGEEPFMQAGKRADEMVTGLVQRVAENSQRLGKRLVRT